MAPRLPRGRKTKSDTLKTRKTVFEKRFPTVNKKAHELSVLCDISVGLICYIDNNFHVYPQHNLDSLRQLLVKFVGLSDQNREKHASHLKDFLPSLNSKKKNPVFAAAESPIDVEGMSSEEFWAMISSMDSKYDGWKQKLDRIKHSEEETNLKETPDELIIAWENNGFQDTVTDQLGFGLCDELNYLECGSTTFDQSVSNFGGDSSWVSAPHQNFGVVDTLSLGISDIDTYNYFGASSNYNFGNTCVGVSQQNQFLSDDSYLTKNPYHLSYSTPTPILYNLGVSGFDQLTAANYQMWDLNPTLIMSNMGVSGPDLVTAADYQMGDPSPTPMTHNLGVWGHDQFMAADSFPMVEPYQMSGLNPTPITSNLEEVSGDDQMRDIYPMAETNVSEGLGIVEDGDDWLLSRDLESIMSQLF